jgi:hypothetical protein
MILSNFKYDLDFFFKFFGLLRISELYIEKVEAKEKKKVICSLSFENITLIENFVVFWDIAVCLKPKSLLKFYESPLQNFKLTKLGGPLRVCVFPLPVWP